ncbi:hypothetical protein IV203_026153 [Nitzschia inconspicua]|uniref:Uncharacterized protein n=1 Tax=Nitzschia inconspicua TaxID=303405 RepID=A0A9K3LJF8_9STRA|nr:hypothetical protein IV203_026153 [Nitzschia inconspicua]
MNRSRSNTPATGGDTGDDDIALSPQSNNSDGKFKSTHMQLSPVSNENPRDTEGDKNDRNADGEDADNNNANTQAEEFKLYKSPRLKGYLMMLLSSIINYHSITVSQNSSDISAVVPNSEQVGYGLTVAMISIIITGVAVVFHFMSWFTYRCDCIANKWAMTIFAPKAKIELFVAIFLLIWWFIATIIQTTVRGIAGDGKQQYNIYYSTWFCTVAALLNLESKLTEYGFPTIKKFVQGWPNRAPGWIAILVSTFFTVFWYTDLYVNTAQNPEKVASSLKPFWGDIPKSQYELLLFVACVTLAPSSIFTFAEIFRNSSERNSEKPSMETYAEGISLLLLTIGWIPSVIVATTPGGFASNIGNAYFFTWSTTVLVLETTVWFIHDSRGGVHKTILQKEQEYRKHQQDVLAATRKLQMEAMRQREEDMLGRRDRSDSDRRNLGVRVERENTDDAPVFGENAMLASEPPISFAGVKEASVPVNEGNTNAFELRNALEDDDALDDTIRQERRMREANKRAYFDALDDILE